MNKNNGMGFGGWLTLTFIVLKLTKVITWSWLWVLSPVWIALALLLSLYIILYFVEGISVNKRVRRFKWYERN